MENKSIFILRDFFARGIFERKKSDGLLAMQEELPKEEPKPMYVVAGDILTDLVLISILNKLELRRKTQTSLRATHVTRYLLQ